MEADRAAPTGEELIRRLDSADLVYLTPFDLPVGPGERVIASQYVADLRPFSVGHFELHADKLVTSSATCDLLKALAGMYQERIRETFRGQRETTIIELRPIAVSGASLDTGGTTLRGVTGGFIRPVILLHGVGTGMVLLWVDLHGAMSAGELLQCRQADRLTVRLDHPDYGLRYMSGSLNMTELTHYLILLTVVAGRPGQVSAADVDRARERAGSTLAAVEEVLSQLPDRRHIYSGYESYPAFALRFDLTASELHAAVAESAAYVRGLVTGDRNWARKSATVVSRIVPTGDVSTRESICWFMHTNGSAKLYSSELETDYLTSVALLMFELDVLLTQRLVLLKTSFYLASIGRGEGYREVLQIRESQLRVLNEFYNSTLAFKDTTAVRLDSMRSVFRIDALEGEASRLLEGLAESQRALYDTRILQRQTFLAVVFAAFGGSSIAYDIASEFRSPRESVAAVVWWTVAGLVGGGGLAALMSGTLLRSWGRRGL